MDGRIEIGDIGRDRYTHNGNIIQSDMEISGSIQQSLSDKRANTFSLSNQLGCVKLSLVDKR